MTICTNSGPYNKIKKIRTYNATRTKKQINENIINKIYNTIMIALKVNAVIFIHIQGIIVIIMKTNHFN